MSLLAAKLAEMKRKKPVQPMRPACRKNPAELPRRKPELNLRILLPVQGMPIPMRPVQMPAETLVRTQRLVQTWSETLVRAQRPVQTRAETLVRTLEPELLRTRRKQAAPLPAFPYGNSGR